MCSCALLNMSQTDQQRCVLGVVVAAAAMMDPKEVTYSRREWTKKWLQRRDERSSYKTLFKELRSEDETMFKHYLRMTPILFSTILEKVKPAIKRQDTVMRECISSGARLEATLLWLANGGSYSALKYLTRISQPSLSFIIPETCTAIYQALQQDYMKVRILQLALIVGMSISQIYFLLIRKKSSFQFRSHYFPEN